MMAAPRPQVMISLSTTSPRSENVRQPNHRRNTGRMFRTTTPALAFNPLSSELIVTDNMVTTTRATMLDLTALIGVPLYTPLFMVLFVRKAPSWAAIFSVGAGLAGSTFGYFSREIFGAPWSYQMKVVVNLGAGAGAYLLSACFWRYTAADFREKIAAFYAKMHRPVDVANEVGRVSDRTQYTVIGIFGTLMGGLICLLMFGDVTTRGRWVIGAVGGTLLVIGSTFFSLSRRAEKVTSR